MHFVTRVTKCIGWRSEYTPAIRYAFRHLGDEVRGWRSEYTPITRVPVCRDDVLVSRDRCVLLYDVWPVWRDDVLVSRDRCVLLDFHSLRHPLTSSPGWLTAYRIAGVYSLRHPMHFVTYYSWFAWTLSLNVHLWLFGISVFLHYTLQAYSRTVLGLTM